MTKDEITKAVLSEDVNWTKNCTVNDFLLYQIDLCKRMELAIDRIAACERHHTLFK